MKSLIRNIAAFVLIASTLLLGGCFGTIETGNVGVRTTFGKVDPSVEHEGVYTSFFSDVTEFSIKENSIDMDQLTPKAKDNLSLKDLDLTVYYKAAPDKVAGLYTKYAGQSGRPKGAPSYIPAYFLVENVARNIVYEEVAKIDSLIIHTQRDKLAEAVRQELQTALNANDPATFTVTRVIVRSVITDPAIETSIQRMVQSQKELETMGFQVQIAAKNAEVEIARATGISKANGIINNSLTKEYLQHEYNLALQDCAKRAGCTMIVGNSTGTLLNVSAPNK
jgi:hypothetical protein